jgi:hypothetical protein
MARAPHVEKCWRSAWGNDLGVSAPNNDFTVEAYLADDTILGNSISVVVQKLMGSKAGFSQSRFRVELSCFSSHLNGEDLCGLNVGLGFGRIFASHEKLKT